MSLGDQNIPGWLGHGKSVNGLGDYSAMDAQGQRMQELMNKAIKPIGIGSMGTFAASDPAAEIRSIFKDTVEVLGAENKRLGEENGELVKRNRELEERLLKAVDLAHKLMERFANGSQEVLCNDRMDGHHADGSAQG